MIWGVAAEPEQPATIVEPSNAATAAHLRVPLDPKRIGPTLRLTRETDGRRMTERPPKGERPTARGGRPGLGRSERAT